MSDLIKETFIAIEAALDAGKAILDIYESDDFEIEFKEDNSPLTKADKAAHDQINRQLKFSNHPILSEEGFQADYDERKNWKTLWIVDPLDGTKEFIKRNGEFTVNIALIEDKSPILGVIYAPVLDLLYFGNKEIGTFKVERAAQSGGIDNILSTAKKLPLITDSKSFNVAVSRSHMNAETKNYLTQLQKEHSNINTLSSGSSLKFCLVAEGSADCYPRFGPTMEWDTAAGQAICEFANCSVTIGTTSEALRYNRPDLLNPSFIVQSLDHKS